MCFALCDAPGTATCTQALGALVRGTPHRGIRRGSAVDDELTRLDGGIEGAGERAAPPTVERADTRHAGAHVHPVGGHTVGEAQGAEDGRDDDDAAVGASLGGAVSDAWSRAW